jgi:hypothetical protein
MPMSPGPGYSNSNAIAAHFAPARAQRIALHIAQHAQAMLILGHRERLEAALVKGAGPLRVMLRVPALRVRESQPTHEFGEIAVALRPNHQMPTLGVACS